jgi:hypothetical protein
VATTTAGGGVFEDNDAGRRVVVDDEVAEDPDHFTAIGAEGFGDRARSELVAIGEAPRKHVADSHEELTAQEAQIARLAGAHRTNPEMWLWPPAGAGGTAGRRARRLLPRATCRG